MEKRQRLLMDAAIIAILLMSGALVYLAFPDNIVTEKMQANLSAVKEMDQAVDARPELRIEILREGTGESAAHGQTLLVHYTGRLLDGTVFDTSAARGEPLSVTLGNGDVIPGWEIGLWGMKVGEERRLTIPAQLAYGEEGIPDIIPGGATIVFDIQLLEIRPVL